MKLIRTRTIQEIELSNNLIAYVRTKQDTTNIRVDLSVYEYQNPTPEMHLYSNMKPGNANIEGMIDIYDFLGDEERIQKLWKKHKEDFYKEEKIK